MQLRKAQPRVRIIAMSGGGRGSAMDYLKVAKHLGAARVLAKPFTDQDLAAAIKGALA